MKLFQIEATNTTIYFIYRLRKVLKLSANKAHDLFGMKYSSYYKMENFDHNLPLERLFYVLDLFKLNLNDLQRVIDLVKSIAESNEHLTYGWSSESGFLSNVSEGTRQFVGAMIGGELTEIDDVEHFDEVLGFKAVAEVDELIYNMIKDSDTYKKALKK
ncbi:MULTISPECIES: helix-turn-helix domain-containing protein [Acinetobacter]|uniref:helix-turn-helix domain-containing protein n=1 Tax=Acinetobacter TaxID=469 RepID=UPI00035DB75B|nr:MULTISPECIES: helix-turn-helix transcriptional regulator [Acinetobacter]MCM5533143.1 helix-turn-helix domain-containing protein [Acinetobacter pittii]MCQ9383098.1 helix-turn-helix domain-containing protein [Acinetobacter pittii]MCR3926036.1 helix-turn-helix domain-containing protein [Acinetobacter pittii]NUF12166.1 helix-turn-helix transcriptional regulator [Acinetobacter oleivorans]RZH25137.1 XRE family transcriptional regulator [Acinetobacter pittii]